VDQFVADHSIVHSLFTAENARPDLGIRPLHVSVEFP
jgi:hypothetical protein